MMSMMPDWITGEMFRATSARAAAALDCVRLETLQECQCVQTLHVGSFDDEDETLDRMHHEFIPGSGLKMAGEHHDI